MTNFLPSILLVLIILVMTNNLICQSSQDDSSVFCDCLNRELALSENINYDSVALHCIGLLAQSGKLKSESDVINLFDDSYKNCPEIMETMKRNMQKADNGINTINNKITPDMNCQNLLGRRYIQYNPAYEEILFNKDQVVEKIINSDLYGKYKLTWTNPCAYYLTLEETNSNILKYHSDTIFVEIINIAQDTLTVKTTVNSTLNIFNYKRIE